jgi:hypothetical protein
MEGWSGFQIDFEKYDPNQIITADHYAPADFFDM